MLHERVIASPRSAARIAGLFYLVTVIASLYEHFVGGASPLAQAARLVSGSSYLTVIWLLYLLLRPAGRDLTILAALFGLVGVARADHSIAFFGVYSLLVGLLILRATFLPKVLGFVMIAAGLGLLVNVYGPLLWPMMPRAASALGFILDAGEIVFAFWLAIVGVDQERWRAQTGAEAVWLSGSDTT